MTRIPKATVEQLWERDQGCCQSCGQAQYRPARGEPFGWSVQHRVNRSQGVNNTLPNLLLLCGGGTTGCHGWVTAHPLAANDLGLSLRSWQDPVLEPVRTLDQTRWALPDGTWSHEPPAEGAA